MAWASSRSNLFRDVRDMLANAVGRRRSLPPGPPGVLSADELDGLLSDPGSWLVEVKRLSYKGGDGQRHSVSQITRSKPADDGSGDLVPVHVSYRVDDISVFDDDDPTAWFDDPPLSDPLDSLLSGNILGSIIDAASRLGYLGRDPFNDNDEPGFDDFGTSLWSGLRFGDPLVPSSVRVSVRGLNDIPIGGVFGSDGDSPLIDALRGTGRRLVVISGLPTDALFGGPEIDLTDEPVPDGSTPMAGATTGSDPPGGDDDVW